MCYVLAKHLLVLCLNPETLCGIWRQWANYAGREISRQQSMCAMARVLLTASCQIYSENQEQNAKCKALKNLQFGQKRSTWKAGDKEAVVAGEIKGTGKKPSALHWKNMKDAWRISRELATSYPSQALRYKTMN